MLGSVTYPFPGTSDFSSYLIQAQASGAKVLGMANAGTDTINTIKQAAEFGITKKMRLAGLLLFLSDINPLRLRPRAANRGSRRRIALRRDGYRCSTEH